MASCFATFAWRAILRSDTFHLRPTPQYQQGNVPEQRSTYLKSATDSACPTGRAIRSQLQFSRRTEANAHLEPLVCLGFWPVAPSCSSSSSPVPSSCLAFFLGVSPSLAGRLPMELRLGWDPWPGAAGLPPEASDAGVGMDGGGKMP